MGRNERHVHEERLFLIALTNIPTDLIGEQVGFIPLIVNRDAVFLKIFAAHVGKGRIKADLGVKVAIKVFKTTLVGVVGHLRMTQMPFAYHCCLIARRLKRLRHKVLGWVHANIVPGKDDAVRDAQANGVTTRHQRSSCRRTDRRCVKAVKPDPLLCQLIE